MEITQGLALIAIGILLYFIPSFIAKRDKKRNLPAIFALNLLTGWTIVGWIIALVWALTVEREV